MAEREGRRVSLRSPAIGELRQSRPGDDIGAGQQMLDQRADGFRADQDRLLGAAPVEQCIGEDMAAVGIGSKLDFIDRDEGDVEIARHRLDRRDPVARGARTDLFLAGDQRHRFPAQPVRQPLHRPRAPAGAAAGRSARRHVPQHPLDGVMGLAGIGRSKQRGQPRDLNGSLRLGMAIRCVFRSDHWRESRSGSSKLRLVSAQIWGLAPRTVKTSNGRGTYMRRIADLI
jgi:hypothetical protein